MTVPGTPAAIETARTVAYTNAVNFQLAEIPGKLVPLVGAKSSKKGKSIEVDLRFDGINFQEVDTRNGDTRTTDIDLERRWIHKPKRQNAAVLVDPDDLETMEIDPKSPIAVQTARGARRAQDNRWLQAYYGNAYTGETGTTAVPFKSANVLASSSAGITKNKLIAMRELMLIRLVDLEMEKPIMLITAKQGSDLLKINEVTNRDYNPLFAQTLSEGKPSDFMGFTFIQTELGNTTVYPDAASLTTSGGERLNPVFVPSGMASNTWMDFRAFIDRRADKNMSEQIYGEVIFACTRVNEDKCFQMANVES
jgi:hypothetical protein